MHTVRRMHAHAPCTHKRRPLIRVLCDRVLQAAAALASISIDVSHQLEITNAGCILPLVAILRGGSASAQAFAAQALANAAAYNTATQNSIAAAGAIPLLLALLSVGKAQVYAAACLSRLCEATQVDPN